MKLFKVSTLPLPQLWSALFFFMLWTLGLDSSMCMIESVSTFVVESAPSRLRSKKTLVTLAICIVFFLASIFFACDAARFFSNFDQLLYDILLLFGKLSPPKTDEFSEKFQTAIDPPPLIFGK